MSLSRKIRELRYAKGWSTIELASRAKISRSALSQLERGATMKPHAETLKGVSRALGVPLEVLLGSPPPHSSRAAERPEPAVALKSPSHLSAARVDELVEMFTVLLSSPLAEALARIVEESSRLVPIIQPTNLPRSTPPVPQIHNMLHGRGGQSDPE